MSWVAQFIPNYALLQAKLNYMGSMLSKVNIGEWHSIRQICQSFSSIRILHYTVVNPYQ